MTELNMENAVVLQDRLIDEQEEHLENNEDVGDLEFSDEEYYIPPLTLRLSAMSLLMFWLVANFDVLSCLGTGMTS